ncbi:MAG: hypothetical protein HC914_07755, partial [Chloroflexaceae bacterium]|nr:hypothetical protein [Chloroflexaceae bacterium]
TTTANPEGVTLNFLRDNLAALLNLSLIDAGRDTQRAAQQRSLTLLNTLDATMDVSTASLDYGQPINYTVRYRNAGTQAAQDVQLVIKAWGPLTLSTPQGAVSEYVVALGDVPAGADLSITIGGMVDEDPDPEDGDTLGINVYVSDAINGLFDWQLVSHNLDSLPPSDVVITEPTGVIAAGIITVRGTALDGSGVPLVTLTVRNLATNATQTIACPDDAPFDGVWSCVVDLSGAQPGDSYALQARAADRVGLTTDSATLVIDVRAFIYLPRIRR